MAHTAKKNGEGYLFSDVLFSSGAGGKSQRIFFRRNILFCYERNKPLGVPSYAVGYQRQGKPCLCLFRSLCIHFSYPPDGNALFRFVRIVSDVAFDFCFPFLVKLFTIYPFYQHRLFLWHCHFYIPLGIGKMDAERSIRTRSCTLVLREVRMGRRKKEYSLKKKNPEGFFYLCTCLNDTELLIYLILFFFAVCAIFTSQKTA